MTTRYTLPPISSNIKPINQWNDLLNILSKNRLGKKLLIRWGKRAWMILEAWLARHPYLQERKTFKEGYRLALWYLVLKNLKREQLVTEYTPMELERATGISYTRVTSWIEGDHKPLLLHSLSKHNLALKNHLAKLPPETQKHRINPVNVYEAFRRIDKTNVQLNDLISSITQLFEKIKSQQVNFIELFPYSQYGPQWLRKISAAIQNDISAVERAINETIEKPNTTIRLGIVNDTLFICFQNTDPNLWLNIDKDELYYFKSPEDKIQLIAKVKNHLSLRSDRSLSRLIIQVVKHCKFPTDNDNIVDFKRKRSRLYIRGCILQFLLDVFKQDITELAPLLHRIGGSKGRGGILNPQFPPIEPLRTRLLATMLSDGHLSKKGGLHYFEKNVRRMKTVEGYIKRMGDVHVWKGIHLDDINWLQISNVVGRRLKTWGMPVGDKAIQQVSLPKYLFTASPEIRCAYLQELIPEDGAFTVRRKGWKPGRFKWSRTFALISSKRKSIQSRSKLNLTAENEAFVYEFLSQFGINKASHIFEDRTVYFLELKWGQLLRLVQSKDQQLAKRAKKFKEIITKAKCKLIEDEKQLAESLGIRIAVRISQILLHEKSKRVSINWRAETKDNASTIRFGLLAPPCHEEKLSAFKEWLNSRPTEEIREIVETLEREGMKPGIQV